jgi:hypothetical protein
MHTTTFPLSTAVGGSILLTGHPFRRQQPLTSAYLLAPQLNAVVATLLKGD